jgi:hypothetical protein
MEHIDQDRELDAQSNGGENQCEAAQHPFSVQGDIPLPDADVGDRGRCQNGESQQAEARLRHGTSIGEERQIQPGDPGAHDGDDVDLAEESMKRRMGVREVTPELSGPERQRDRTEQCMRIDTPRSRAKRGRERRRKHLLTSE